MQPNRSVIPALDNLPPRKYLTPIWILGRSEYPEGEIPDELAKLATRHNQGETLTDAEYDKLIYYNPNFRSQFWKVLLKIEASKDMPKKYNKQLKSANDYLWEQFILRPLRLTTFPGFDMSRLIEMQKEH
jgi:hypothetical protein